jgi:hypothetical protein
MKSRNKFVPAFLCLQLNDPYNIVLAGDLNSFAALSASKQLN